MPPLPPSISGLHFDDAALGLELGGDVVSASISSGGEATDVRVANVAGGSLVRTAR